MAMWPHTTLEVTTQAIFKVLTNESFVYLLHCMLQSDDAAAARPEVIVRLTLAVADEANPKVKQATGVLTCFVVCHGKG